MKRKACWGPSLALLAYTWPPRRSRLSSGLTVRLSHVGLTTRVLILTSRRGSETQPPLLGSLGNALPQRQDPRPVPEMHRVRTKRDDHGRPRCRAVRCVLRRRSAGRRRRRGGGERCRSGGEGESGRVEDGVGAGEGGGDRYQGTSRVWHLRITGFNKYVHRGPDIHLY